MQARKSAPSLSIPNAFQAAGRKISFFRNVVHGNRDSQHRSHCDKVCADMSIGDCTMVSAPVIHYIVSILECAFFSVASWSKPCAWPCVVCTFPEIVRYFLRKSYCPSLCDLKNRSKSFYKVQTDHSCRHLSLCFKTAGVSASTEVSVVGHTPFCVVDP